MKTQDTVQIDGIDKIILNGLMQDAHVDQSIGQAGGISGAAVHPTLKEIRK